MKKSILIGLSLVLFGFGGCNDDDLPPIENPEEIIDQIELLFAPKEGAPVVIKAVDEDAEGPKDMVAEGAINLLANTEYELFITLRNTTTDQKISDEVEEEAHEHMFYFEFTNDIFDSPTGDGNIDRRADHINYLDKDSLNLPLGLITGWVTRESKSGTFRLILKHQPDIKSDISTAKDGVTDIDFTWILNVE